MTTSMHRTARTTLRVLAQGAVIIGTTLALLPPLARWLVPHLDPTSPTRAATGTLADTLADTPTDSPLVLSAIGVLIAGVGLLLWRRLAAERPR